MRIFDRLFHAAIAMLAMAAVIYFITPGLSPVETVIVLSFAAVLIIGMVSLARYRQAPLYDRADDGRDEDVRRDDLFTRTDLAVTRAMRGLHLASWWPFPDGARRLADRSERTATEAVVMMLDTVEHWGEDDTDSVIDMVVCDAGTTLVTRHFGRLQDAVRALHLTGKTPSMWRRWRLLRQVSFSWWTAVSSVLSDGPRIATGRAVLVARRESLVEMRRSHEQLQQFLEQLQGQSELSERAHREQRKRYQQLVRCARRSLRDLARTGDPHVEQAAEQLEQLMRSLPVSDAG